MDRKRPSVNAPQDEWITWANEQFPYSGYRPQRLGFEVLRGIEDPQMRRDVLWAIVLHMPADPMDKIPPMPDYGYRQAKLALEPERRLPPEKDDDTGESTK